MLWPDFCIYVWDMNREISRDKAKGDGSTDVGYRSEGFGAPSRDELLEIPWGGDGDDPLEELGR